MRSLKIILIGIIIGLPISIIADSLTPSVTVGIFECSDTIDNDGDGVIDFPNDPSCSSALDDDETLPLSACEDGSDNDSDGNTDFPDDLGCDSVYDDDESGPTSSGGGGGGGGGGSSSSSEDGSASVTIEGLAYPSGSVNLLKGGKKTSNTIAGTDGKFYIELDNLKTGTYSFSISGTDSSGYNSTMFFFTIRLFDNLHSSVVGIFLAPTLTTDKKEVKRGDSIKIFGTTAPNSDVKITVHSEQEFILGTMSDSFGRYFFNFNSGQLESGKHESQSYSDLDGVLSSVNDFISFKVGSKNVFRKAPSASSALKGDINLDGRVNLVDFSVAVFWYQKTLTSDMRNRESKVLNGDEVIDLVDFSIMAFHWTG